MDHIFPYTPLGGKIISYNYTPANIIQSILRWDIYNINEV